MADKGAGKLWRGTPDALPLSSRRVQAPGRRVLREDILGVCFRSASLSAAGRVLFDHSRERKKIANDADRLRKYLARFDLEWGELKERFGSSGLSRNTDS
jgi:transcriptional regulatory protein RtcR